MRLLSFCIALIGLASTSVLAESINPDPNDWFKEQYAPLWKAEPWNSVLAGYQSDQLNPSTALFKSKWLDLYADGSEEFSCAWYMADLNGGRWTFTDYSEIECADHDL